MTRGQTVLDGIGNVRFPPSPDQLSGRSARAASLQLIRRRVLLAPLVFLGVTIAVFIMIDLSPNDPIRARLGMHVDEATYQREAEAMGLNDPLPVRYLSFLSDLLRLDLGDSYVRPESVSERIGLALPVTVQLMIFSTLIAIVLGTVLGVLAARHEGRLVDRSVSGLAAVLQAAPQFWIGLLFILLFAIQLQLLPSGGYSPPGAGLSLWFSSLIGPSVVLAMPFAAALTRMIRTSVADELAKDYVRTAVSAGVRDWIVLGRNVLRNALITPVTALGVHIGALMSGAVLVEVVFNLPGMGTLLVSGIAGSDLGVVRGVAIVGAAAFLLTNLAVDLLYLALNTRSADASTR